MKRFIMLLAMLPVLAQAWQPIRPVTAIVPINRGSSQETVFRELTKIVNQSQPDPVFVIQNMPGAEGVVAMNHMLGVPADGHTIVVPNPISVYITSPVAHAKLVQYQPSDFVNIVTMGRSPLILIAHPDSTVRTPRDFVNLIRTTTRPVSIGMGGGFHGYAFDYIMKQAQGNSLLVHAIKFNSGTPAVISVAGYSGKDGTEFALVPIPVAKSLLDAGRVRAIGITSNQPMPGLTVPLMSEVIPGMNFFSTWCISLPATTPRPVQDWYQQTFSAAVKSKEFQQWAVANYIIVDDRELATAGVQRMLAEQQQQFQPLLNKK